MEVICVIQNKTTKSLDFNKRFVFEFIGDGGASGLTGFAGSIQLVGFENKPSWQSIDGKQISISY